MGRAVAAGFLVLLALVLIGPEVAFRLAERSPLATDLPEGETLAKLLSS